MVPTDDSSWGNDLGWKQP